VARTYTVPSCVQITIPGKNTQNRIVNGCFLSVAKCLELALNEGKSFRYGKQIGCKTPDPLSFHSIEDVMEAYLAQVRYAVDKAAKISNLAQEVYRQRGQLPFTSVLIDGCIEKGKDCTEWTEYSYSHMIAPGWVNVADSLAAMKKLVFEGNKITMKELLLAMKANFEGYEDMRQKLLRAPKFGNDDDYVDNIMHDVVHLTQEEVKKFKNIWGYPWTLDGSVAGGYYATGTATWALPDGKREGRMEAYADGTISPAAGRDKNGPTAVIKSMGKVDPPVSQTGNQKFLSQFLEGKNKEKFAAYLKTWADLGGWHIQFNTVDRDTLIQAQQHPEQHSDLIIRVAGYSAYFVDIPKGLQDDIIARTVQSF
jgi:formate C-acetyltransferase